MTARDLGLLALRVGVGGTLVAHGAQKLFGWFGGAGLEQTGKMFEQLGFRQFLVMASNPTDSLGRFEAMYIGSVAPVKQGRFDGCQLSSGPGKVVLHQ